MTGGPAGHIPATLLDGPASPTAGLPALTVSASHLRTADRLTGQDPSVGPGQVLNGEPPSRVTGAGPPQLRPVDRSGAWLRNAMAGLAVLAAAAAVVSFQAQYQMVAAYKHRPVIAAIQAGIPDAAALVFACLGIALALHGKRALRARALNVASVATSVAMNALAASPGWRAVAVWVLPPVAYALASDTLIGVVRAWAIARQRSVGERLAEEDATPLAVLGGLLLWLLRVVAAPRSTLVGFRAWVVEECPVAPGRRALPIPQRRAELSTVRHAPGRASGRRGLREGSKTQRFLALVADRHGPLALIPPGQVSRICTVLAPEVGLNTGAARTALRKAVLAAKDGRTP
jgi:hypothetical protein